MPKLVPRNSDKPAGYRLGVRLVRAAKSAFGDLFGLALVAAVVLIITLGSTIVVAVILSVIHGTVSPDTPYRDQVVCWVQTDVNGHPQLMEAPRREEPFSDVVEVHCP